jgi:ankyrin repeat protein
MKGLLLWFFIIGVTVFLSSATWGCAPKKGNASCVHDDGPRMTASTLMEQGNGDYRATCQNNQGISVALNSVKKGNINDVRKFIEMEPSLINACDGWGRTLLQEACYDGHKNIVELLVSKGADVNSKDKMGHGPLHLSCSQGHRDISELLISKGAHVNADYGKGSPLYQACSGGHRDVAELLISKGADMKVKSKSGNTLLHSACISGHKDVVELLISKGADVNARNIGGNTPLTIVKTFGGSRTEEIKALLLKHGAKE